MIDWLTSVFAEWHRWVFETAVLPLLYALGGGGLAERAFEATEFFLIGVCEVSLLAAGLSILERWRPAEEQTDAAGRRLDMLYTLLTRLGLVPLSMFFLLMPLIDELDAWLRMHNLMPLKLEDALPVLNAHPLVSFLVYLAILDFVAYWLHRWQHRFEWWWALHALHHSQREMSFWTDDRNHLLDDLLIDGAHALVALAIGVPPAQFVAIVVATRMLESLSHANLRAHFGRFGERLLVSPRFHRMHHAIGMGHEGRTRGCNFAVLFPIWDVLFGTARFDPVYPATGIRDQLSGRDYGSGFWRQQWLGMRRMAAASRRV